MKLISWNVNGLRAIVKKDDFMNFFRTQDADVFCLQETKMQPNQLEMDLPGYHQYYNSAVRKGYSGVAIYSKREPLSVSYGIGLEEHDQEGRVLTAEYEDFYLVCVYTPNSKDGLLRIDYRMEWEDAFRAYLHKLHEKKPVIVCGDMNVAHEEIDLKHPKENRGNAGFSDQEREKMTVLLNSGFIDTFRYFYPEAGGRYSWWSYRFNARKNNAGWRIDYFLVTEDLKEKLEDAVIYDDIYGSDHCPVGLILK